MRQQEFPHNTPEQVREYLTNALTLVEEFDPPEDLRPLVFNNAVALYSTKQIMFEQPTVIPNLAAH